jgi:protein-disulfide isomerase
MMTKLKLAAAALLAAAFCFAPAVTPMASAQTAAPLSKAEEARVRQIVREYLLSNPEVLEEAQRALELKRERAAFAKLANDPRHFSVGPKNAKVHVVELFDYRCGYCKSALAWAMDKVATRKDVRFTFVEFPILTDESVDASRAAVASIKQGKYLPFHRALMNSRGALDAKEVDALAKSVGIDVARMRRDMDSDAVTALLTENHEIAASAGINGTPAFLINGKYMRGGYQADLLDKELKAASAAKR